MLKTEAKKNVEVTFTRRNGNLAAGVIFAAPEQKRNGVWVLVNTGSKERPDLTNVRLENLKLKADTKVDSGTFAAREKKPVAKATSGMSKGESKAISESLARITTAVKPKPAKMTKTERDIHASIKPGKAPIKTPVDKKPSVAAVKALAKKK